MAKGDKLYFENYCACAALAKKAAAYLVECLENYDAANIEKMLETMHTYEHSADMKKHEMMHMLNKAFITPIEREDILSLAQMLSQKGVKTFALQEYRPLNNGVLVEPDMQEIKSFYNDTLFENQLKSLFPELILRKV